MPFTAANPPQFRAAFPQPPRPCPPNQPASTHPHLFQESPSFWKTAVYAGGLGRKGLGDVLHPPLDNGLRTGLIEYFHGRSDMLEKVDFGAIKNITDYAHSAGPAHGSPAYRTVIEGCCVAAKELGCSLIEVEQLAGLGLLPGEAPPGKLVSRICRGVG